MTTAQTARECSTVYDRLVATYGQEIADEVIPRFAEVMNVGSPALRAHAHELPDYFARSALWKRELKADEVRWRNQPRPELALPEAPHRRRRKATGEGAARGEAHPAARLNDALVRSIRQRRAIGEASSQIAADVGVSKRMIDLIVRRERWAHVPDEA